MKKFITIFSVFFLFISFNPNKSYSDQNNIVLEYCTGTWCQWCPCGHDIISEIQHLYPNAVVLGYHGAGSDPWQSYSSGIRSLFGFSAYPTGVIGRRTGIISRSAWYSEAVSQTTSIQPGVSISVTNKTYDASSRTLSATVRITPLADITGDFYVNYVLTENNLIYAQTGNGSCPGDANYVHDDVVKSMMNGDLGELVHSGTWTTGAEVVRSVSYVVPDAPQVSNVENCEINILVYQQGSSIASNYNIQQAIKTPVSGTTGIIKNNIAPTSYSLTQNYPNPFNPTTSFTFSIPKNETVSLKFYDILGNEVETYIDGFLNAGSYSVEFDGTKYSSGIYFYRLTSGSFIETKKMNLIK